MTKAVKGATKPMTPKADKPAKPAKPAKKLSTDERLDAVVALLEKHGMRLPTEETEAE